MPHALTSRDSAMESKPLGSYEPSGIEVLIIGTGLAGLTAALECIRKGHSVRVLEKSESINTNGQPNSNASSAWPKNLHDFRRHVFHGSQCDAFS